eukprot:scaffold52205_cov21-Prasinocladus_malaysianus.AAC.1
MPGCVEILTNSWAYMIGTRPARVEVCLFPAEVTMNAAAVMHDAVMHSDAVMHKKEKKTESWAIKHSASMVFRAGGGTSNT